MTPSAGTAPAAVAGAPADGFEVRYKPDGGRWRVLATAPSREAAVARMFDLMDVHPGGGWHVAAVPHGLTDGGDES